MERRIYLLRVLKMVKLQQMADESFFVVIRKALVQAKGWKKGDEMACLIVGGEIVPQMGDIILRKVG